MSPGAADTVAFAVREERPEDVAAIDEVIREAFRRHPFSRQTEHRIVRGLREAGALSLSLVALHGGRVVGHVAFSPVAVGGRDLNWWGLGPLAVAPETQRIGVGSALVRSGLRRLAGQAVAGCVVLGDPRYYGRFGFAPIAGLVCPGAPPAHFMARVCTGDAPAGEVAFHPAFSLVP